MKHDLFAEYAGQWQDHTGLDRMIQVQLLAEALVTDKTKAQQSLKDWILQKELDAYLQQQQQNFLKLLDIHPDISLHTLLAHSFVIQFTFKLRKPYLSKDEQDFYIIDNPVRKDKVFRFPYVAPSSWKGSLRSAMRFIREIKDEAQERSNDQMTRLFGPIKGEEVEEHFRQGRLRFFPTFFDQISLEVINPHDRQTGAGKKPIYIESVPIETKGTFTLLYVPFDRIGQDESETKRQAAADLKVVAEGIKGVFTQYGFGAKTSSGFGVANIQVGTVMIRIKDDPQELKEDVEQAERILQEAAHD